MERKQNHRVPLWTQYLSVYDWPARDGKRPFDHQVETWWRLLQHKRFLVLNDIGTGKTRTVAWALHFLAKQIPGFRAVVVAPLSTLETTWLRELVTVDIGLQPVVLTGSRTQRLKRLAQPWKVAIINPDGLKILVDELPPVNVLVLDEVTYYRNPRTQRWKAVKKYMQKCASVWGLTGNLTPREPTDAWGPLKLLVPERLPRSFRAFRDELMFQVSQFKWIPREHAHERLAEYLRGISIRYKRDECLDLPPVQHIYLDVPPTAEQRKLAKQLQDEFAVLLEDGAITAANAAVLVNKVLQIYSGVVYYETEEGERAERNVDVSHRLEALEAIIEDADTPVLVFAQYRSAVSRLAKWAKAKGYRHVEVTGDTSPKKRKEAFDAIQSRSVDLMVAHPRAMAHGVTLTGASVVVWWSATADQEIYLQANGRVTRPGQENRVVIYHLVSSHVERRMYSMLQERKVTSARILEMVEQFTEGGE